MINQCLILCGGYGTRLKKITKKTPKPLIKYFEKEFLTYLIDKLINQGIDNIVLLTYYKNNLFKKYVKKIKKNHKNLKIKIVCEKEKIGTGGALINSINYQNPYFFLLNGDTLFDINLRDFQKRSNIEKNFISIAAVTTANTRKKKSSNFIVKKNILKEVKETYSKRIKKSGGIYLINKKILKKYSKNIKKNLDFDKDIIKENLFTNKIRTYFYYNKFLDIGENIQVFEKSKKKLQKIITKPCCFLDRDGVINYDKKYTFRKKDFKFKPQIKKAIKFLNDSGFYTVIVTNQSGIARGYYSLSQLESLHKYMLGQFHQYGAYIDKIYFSPYHPDGKIPKFKKKSNLRKPNVGMLKKCEKDFRLNKSKSFLIGDKYTDILAAKNFKIKGFYVENNIFNQIKKILNNFKLI